MAKQQETRRGSVHKRRFLCASFSRVFSLHVPKSSRHSWTLPPSKVTQHNCLPTEIYFVDILTTQDNLWWILEHIFLKISRWEFFVVRFVSGKVFCIFGKNNSSLLWQDVNLLVKFFGIGLERFSFWLDLLARLLRMFWVFWF